MASRSELGCLLQSTIGIFYKICEAQKQLAKIKRRKNRRSNDNDLGAWGWQMARNDEAEEILALEMEASQIGYGAAAINAIISHGKRSRQQIIYNTNLLAGWQLVLAIKSELC